jgi:tetratricopeptide (TPR) repeat protein
MTAEHLEDTTNHHNRIRIVKLDQYGFPIPEGFDDQPNQNPFAPGKRSLAAILVLGLLALAGFAAAKFGPDAVALARQQLHRRQADELVERAERDRRQGRLRQAVERASRAIDLDSRHMDALAVRAACYSELRRYDDAVADYERLLEADPDNPLALNNRAYNLALVGRQLDEALRDVERALKLHGPDEAFLDTRGYVLYLLGRPQEALADLDAAIELMHKRGTLHASGGAGEIYYHRALIHQKLGNREQADDDFRRAREFGYEVPLPV